MHEILRSRILIQTRSAFALILFLDAPLGPLFGFELQMIGSIGALGRLIPSREVK